MKSFGRLIIFGVAAAGCVGTALIACGSDPAGTLNCGPGTMQVGSTCVVVSTDGAPQNDGTVGSEGGSETGSDGAIETGQPNGCPSDKGPKMARLPRPDGGALDGSTTFCMDTTEITQAQYEIWYSALPLNPPQPPDCTATTFRPHDTTTQFDGCKVNYDPLVRPDYPVACVDHCQAEAYCLWAGKKLCPALDPPNNSLGILSQRERTLWSWTCSNGRTTAFEYGNVIKHGACVESSYDGGDGKNIARPVASAPLCKGTASPYEAVHDLDGNLAEWQALCDKNNNCLYLGASYATDPDQNDCFGGASGVLQDWQFSEGLGFRCCAD